MKYLNAIALSFLLVCKPISKKKVILIIGLFIAQINSFAQTAEPTIKKSVAKIKEFIPAKWKLIAEAKGDLNKDGLIDVALVIEDTDLLNFIINKDKMGGDTLNLNPRYLLVAFKKANGFYELIAKNGSFIPTKNSQESPCLSDPFDENGSVQIVKGLLEIHFQNFYSCGAWEIYNFDYIFRFQNKSFELIGYNKSSSHRSSGEQTTTTINFSTKKMNYSSGLNAFKEGGKLKTVWKNIQPKKIFDLNSITEDSINLSDY